MPKVAANPNPTRASRSAAAPTGDPAEPPYAALPAARLAPTAVAVTAAAAAAPTALCVTYLTPYLT